jgi:hypothetical protein
MKNFHWVQSEGNENTRWRLTPINSSLPIASVIYAGSDSFVVLVWETALSPNIIHEVTVVSVDEGIAVANALVGMA